MSRPPPPEPKPRNNFNHLAWYHGDLSRHKAEVLLMFNGEEGSFLLRDIEAGVFCISARGKGAVHHFKLEYNGMMYRFGIQAFDSYESLMKYLANKPIIGTEQLNDSLNPDSPGAVMLTYPYPARVPEPDTFSDMKMQSNRIKNGTEKSLEEHMKATPIASKAGYLMKEGGNIKSWKKRWFSCIRNDLSYFENHLSETPIKTINLSEAIMCTRGRKPGTRTNILLECEDRKWNFRADTEEEAIDWLAVLKWKIFESKRYGSPTY